jgi:predicted DNA-binding transcriptional regulator AlpA
MLTDQELELGGYRFEDMQEKRIVKNRTDLLRKQTDMGFPRGIKTGASQVIFLKAEVHAWLRGRAAQRDALPPPMLPDGMKRRRGRPPKMAHAATVERPPPVAVKPRKHTAREPEVVQS